MKIYIPFKQIHSLKKALKKRITYYAEHKYKINENLCKKYNLDYNKVVEDKHKLYKYTTKFDFYLHRINSKPNLYFTYLKYILMDKLVGNIHFKFSYIKIINLTFSRYFMLFRKLVWPHIYVISSFLADKFCKYYNFIISHCLFVIGCLFFVPKFIYDAMRVRLEKIIKIFRTLYWLFITRNKK
jgi:hypothetical protein